MPRRQMSRRFTSGPVGALFLGGVALYLLAAILTYLGPTASSFAFTAWVIGMLLQASAIVIGLTGWGTPVEGKRKART